MFKKLLVIGGLLLVGSWAWSKTDLGSYVKTGWKELWGGCKKSVPVGFEIKRAEEMLASLDKADDRLISTIASETVTIRRMDKEVGELETSVAKLREEIQLRNEDLKTGAGNIKVGNTEYSSTQLAKDLERSFKFLKQQEANLKAKKELLVEHKQRLDAAKEQRESLKAEKSQLQARIEKLKTDLEILKAAETKSKRGLDDSQVGELAKLKELVDGLEQRIETNMIEVQLRDEPKPAAAGKPALPTGNISKEIDDYFAPGKIARD